MRATRARNAYKWSSPRLPPPKNLNLFSALRSLLSYLPKGQTCFQRLGRILRTPSRMGRQSPRLGQGWLQVRVGPASDLFHSSSGRCCLAQMLQSCHLINNCIYYPSQSKVRHTGADEQTTSAVQHDTSIAKNPSPLSRHIPPRQSRSASRGKGRTVSRPGVSERIS